MDEYRNTYLDRRRIGPRSGLPAAWRPSRTNRVLRCPPGLSASARISACALRQSRVERLTCLKALEKLSTARAFLPLMVLTASSTALLINISAQPPPKTVRVSLTVCDRTESASCSDRSASSTICVVAPRRTTVHASPAATPENLMSC